ncbi:MAG TPA: class I SAM-dependent methyltransferase, partial [Vicinamibacterales bacterium]|nr:class I SAM-dependent methyltransferase [Vicinamibacterales bacterium]
MTDAAPSTVTLRARASYGWRVMQRATGVLRARWRPLAGAEGTVAFNAMFDTTALHALDRERAELERFDLYLFDAMNTPRLRGQIVFEYGTLLRGTKSWPGLVVLDVGTGRSTLPRWMSAAGAAVVTFDLASPVEQPTGGFQSRIDALVARKPGVVRAVSGSMRALPFASASFDLVTSLSVVEHLDTELPARVYVPYAEQQVRLAGVLDEMIRVTRSGGHIFVTSECCDYSRATSDNWRSAYYYDEGP